MMGIEPITRKEMFMASAAGESVSTLTPVTREEYFLSRIGGGGGGGGTQSDLSQTDITQPDYVKGVIRQESLPEGYPYYGELVTTEVVPTTTVEFDGGGALMNVIDFKPTVGLTYLVNWKGTEYECTAQALDMKGTAVVLVGDGSSAGLIGNGEPFVILYIPEMETVQVSQTGGYVAETVTISISEIASEVHTMAKEFIPDNTFTIMFQYYNGSVESSVTLEEIENALSDGKEIKAKMVYLTGSYIGGGSPMFYIGNAQCIHFDFYGSSAYINVYTCTSEGWEKRSIPLATT